MSLILTRPPRGAKTPPSDCALGEQFYIDLPSSLVFLKRAAWLSPNVRA